MFVIERRRANSEKGHLASAEHHDAVAVRDGVEAMRDGEGGAPLENLADGALELRVRFHVARCRRLVQQNNLRAPQQRPRLPPPPPTRTLTLTRSACSPLDTHPNNAQSERARQRK
eukprot:1189209-Prorocentrum_minimum.AAC.2